MKNIVLIGMPGSGKTTFGRLLAKEMKRNFYDADEVLETREETTIKDLFAQSEEIFRDAETRTVKYLSALSGAIIATGGGVIKRAENMEMLKKNGVIVFIDRKPANIMNCIHNEFRPLLADDRLKIFKLYEERIDLYKKYADYIIGNNGSSADTIEKLVKYARGLVQ